MQIKNNHVLIDLFQTFLNANVPRGGKAIIDVNGMILSSNDLNLVFSLTKGTFLSDISSEMSPYFSSKILEQFTVDSESIQHNIPILVRGVRYSFQMTISPLSMDTLPLFLVDFTDITHFTDAVKLAKSQRQRIENELLLRTKEIVQTDLFTKDNGGFLTNFMRGLRHDLLSPVSQLKDIIEYYRSTKDPKKKEQASHLIDNCLEKLSNTARGFSDFVDLHILPQNRTESIDIEEIFTEAKMLLEEEFSQAEASITTNFKSEKTLVFNRVIMYSIVHNLLSNAIKFRKKGTTPVISVKTFRKGNFFIFSIEDNGTGIDLPTHASKLFVPFQRLDPSRSGVGVGLSMIKNALVRYQGDIQIESILGEGTTITVSIPQEQVL